MLVDEETELLATIDRYKTEAQKYNKELSIQRFLDRVAQPKKWKYKDGTTTEMEYEISIHSIFIPILLSSVLHIPFVLEN